ncbi:unnamed protein product [Linum tenue]|uniref:Ribulose-bisphosphate carboxylase n=2 Tax=Linum tenue TaxID=586396 RepID=A0AAV0QZT8_9ROSI|nr:unnamed protein product [Linum tenue]
MSCREGLMSPQTETKSSVGFQAGVKDYKLTYYTPDYETKDTKILSQMINDNPNLYFFFSIFYF